MAIDVLHDKRKGIAVFYCNTTGVAFGPGIRDAESEIQDDDAYEEIWRDYCGLADLPEDPYEMAEDFLHYCLRHHGDPRDPSVCALLPSIKFQWQEHLVARVRKAKQEEREQEANEALEYQRAIVDQAGPVGDA